MHRRRERRVARAHCTAAPRGASMCSRARRKRWPWTPRPCPRCGRTCCAVCSFSPFCERDKHAPSQRTPPSVCAAVIDSYTRLTSSRRSQARFFGLSCDDGASRPTCDAMQGDWVALCTVVSATAAEEKLWFSRARQFHRGVARCLLQIADLPLQLKVKAGCFESPESADASA